MILTALITGLAVLIGNLFLLFVAMRVFNRQKQAILNTLRLYFEAPDKDTPSQFSQTIDIITSRAGYHTAQSLKATFMQAQGAEAKATKSITGAATHDMLAQQGLAGAILSSYPAVTKLVNKNPHWLPLANQILGNMGKGGGFGMPTNGGHESNVDPFYI